MSTAVIAVGRMKEKPYRQMADEYVKRLSRFGKFEEIELNDLPEPAGSSPALEEQLRIREGEAMLQRLKQGDHVIALTIPGKRMSSEELAAHVAELRNRGAGRLVFLVGGSLGLGSNVLARADEELSMGPMTFPHQLARILLLEQIYRGFQIEKGSKYHK